MESIEKLVTMFVETAIEYGNAQTEGNSKKSNRAYDKINDIEQKLVENNSLTHLVDLMEHSNDYVRFLATSKLLSIKPQKARETLLELSNQRNLLGFSAKMTLVEWEKGNIE